MKSTYLTAVFLSLAAVTPASAMTLDFNSRASWLAQVTGVSNFDGTGSLSPLAVGGVQTYNTSAGLALADLQIIGFNTNNATQATTFDLSRVLANGSQAWYQWGSGTIIRTGDKTLNNTVFARLVFPNPVSAFGFNYGAGGSSGAPGSITIIPNGAAPVDVTSSQQPSFGFFGMVSDTQTFTSVDILINDNTRYLVLDDIAQGTYVAQNPNTETAEPGTLLQLAMGAGLIAAARRRRAVAHTEAV